MAASAESCRASGDQRRLERLRDASPSPSTGCDSVRAMRGASEPRRSLWPALAGVAYVVLVFVGSAVIGGTSGAGRHSLDQSLDDVGAYLRDADATRVWIGEYVAVLGYALFVPFAAFASSALRGDAARDWGDASIVGSAIVYVALSLVATACLAPVVNRGDAAGAAQFLDLRSVLFAMAFVFFALWLLGVGMRALRARSLPAWLGSSAVVVAVLQLVGTAFAGIDPGFTGVPTFAGFLWVVTVSALLARRRVEPAGRR